MKRFGQYLAGLVLSVGMFSVLLFSLEAPCGPRTGGSRRWGPAPPQPMSFFITSVPKGDGANYGGLAGADALLPAAGGRGRPRRAATWRAYLSTQGPGAVNARDRIGNGPWFNARGSDGRRRTSPSCTATRSSRRASATRSASSISLTEKGELVNGVGDMPNQHDILTGSQPDGRAYTDAADHTCSN